MLDKSVPYRNILMKLAAEGIGLPAPAAPAGYWLRMYEKGDEAHWARIETAVLEFKNQDKAADCFAQTFLPYPSELSRRCVFAVDGGGVPVATATAWWTGGGEERLAMLHWVAVHPAHQGKGLGKAVTGKALSLFRDCEGGRDVYLHTQTWSHVAVRMYFSLGFRMLRTGTPGGQQNDFEQAVEVLRGVMDPAFITRLTNSAL